MRGGWVPNLPVWFEGSSFYRDIIVTGALVFGVATVIITLSFSLLSHLDLNNSRMTRLAGQRGALVIEGLDSRAFPF